MHDMCIDLGIAGGEAVILSTGTPIPAQLTCRRRCRERAEKVDMDATLYPFAMPDEEAIDASLP